LGGEIGVSEVIGVSEAAATYVYCVVQSPGAPDLAGAPPGLPGTTPLRLLALADGLWLVAAGAPLPEYGGEEIEGRLADLSWVGDRAMAHERVVEHFAAVSPVVPMKLFTLFTSDERAVAGLSARREEMERVFSLIAGRVEWGVRILFQEGKARQALADAAEREEAPASSGSSGKNFLLRKKGEQERARALAGQVRLEVDRAYEDLARHAAAARRHESVRRWADRLAGHACELTLTGPWPPYNFIGDPA
jgi:hypothetical protein